MGQSNWESNAFLWSPWSWQQWWLLPREWESGNSHENSWASQENSDTWESGKRFGGWILPLPHGNWHSTAKLECYSIMKKTDFFQKAFLTPPDKLICSHLFSYSSEHMIILKILSPCILNICLHHCLPSTLRSYYKQWLNLTQFELLLHISTVLSIVISIVSSLLSFISWLCHTDLISLTRARLGTLAVKAQSLNLWTTREFPNCQLLNKGPNITRRTNQYSSH